MGQRSFANGFLHTEALPRGPKETQRSPVPPIRAVTSALRHCDVACAVQFTSARLHRSMGNHAGIARRRLTQGHHLDQACAISATSNARRQGGLRAEMGSRSCIPHGSAIARTRVSTVRRQTATASQSARKTFMHHSVRHRVGVAPALRKTPAKRDGRRTSSSPAI